MLILRKILKVINKDFRRIFSGIFDGFCLFLHVLILLHFFRPVGHLENEINRIALCSLIAEVSSYSIHNEH